MDITWIELHPDSRSFEIGRGSISKDFIFVITCDDNLDFVDNATINYLPTTSLVLYNDDAVVQQEILAVFWQQIPIFFEFVVDNQYSVLLWISSLRAEQLNWNQWKIFCTFDVPQDNGSNQGGENQPDQNLEKNSEQYTQISFNASIVQEKRQMATIKECNVLAVAGPTERALGNTKRDKRQLIGQKDDEILGYECNTRNFGFSITQYMKPNKLTFAYVRRLSRLIGSLNLDVFFGFSPWSVMCVGCDGSGTVYQAVPVKLDFEVKPNYRMESNIPSRIVGGITELGTPDLLPPIEDSYIGPDVHGVNQVFTLPQYIRKYEPEFYTNGGNNLQPDLLSTTFYSGLDVGVHSGWSQIFYEYISKVVPDEKNIVRVPIRRYHYLPEDYIPAYFSQFLL